MTVNHIAQNIPRINTTLEDRKDKHKSTMIEIKGTILNQIISILIDLGATVSYINPQIVEKCNLKFEKFKNAWLV